MIEIILIMVKREGNGKILLGKIVKDWNQIQRIYIITLNVKTRYYYDSFLSLSNINYHFFIKLTIFSFFFFLLIYIFSLYDYK